MYMPRHSAIEASPAGHLRKGAIVAAAALAVLNASEHVPISSVQEAPIEVSTHDPVGIPVPEILPSPTDLPTQPVTPTPESAPDLQPLQPVPTGMISRIVIDRLGADMSVLFGTSDGDGGTDILRDDLYIDPPTYDPYVWNERATAIGVNQQGEAVLDGSVYDQQLIAPEIWQHAQHGASVFGRLQELQEGDDVIVYTDAGAVLTYRLEEAVLSVPKDPHAQVAYDPLADFDRSADTLLLVACDPGETGLTSDLSVAVLTLVASAEQGAT